MLAQAISEHGANGNVPIQTPAQNVEEYRTGDGWGRGPQMKNTSEVLEVQCGPLLNYKRMSNPNSPSPTWHGSVLIVTKPGYNKSQVQLTLRCLASMTSGQDANIRRTASDARSFSGERLYEDPRVAFWRFSLDLPIQDTEARWEYDIAKLRCTSDSTSSSSKSFCVPSVTQSMRIMFHSCNGFSVGTDMPTYSGPGSVMWEDVLRQHEQMPIHCMIGGGDQIYNDGIRVTGPLREWTDMRNPHKRREYAFNEQMRAKCDEWYLQNYMQWYSHKPFSNANSSIPQINIWDDHDIIDGFGSYTDHFMKCAVFRGIGGVAHKYYLLFQHHEAPPASTFTTANASTMDSASPSVDPEQLKNAFVMVDKHEDPSFIFGDRPGPYVEERSRSLYCQLGAHVAFAGLDARTERTRHQINYPDTYKKFFGHVSQQLAESQGKIRHLILLLGVPIAYPRLQWLENILTSPIIGPIRFLSKRFGVGGGLFNNFDGGVDLLDDLDDHYTAHQHKGERKELVHQIQKLAAERKIRVTILSGDVHLGALGRFYSNPKLNVVAREDHRYMTNIVSSAITNKPPPKAVADLLARRNKIHHLDSETDETLLNLFDQDPGMDKTRPEGAKRRTAEQNHCTMPSRNYALITESHEHPSREASDETDGGSVLNGVATEKEWITSGTAHHNFSRNKGNPRDPMHSGEANCGSKHPAASGLTRTGLGGQYGLDVTFRVEINSKDPKGQTFGYGLTIPTLEKVHQKHAKVDELKKDLKDRIHGHDRDEN